jgi:hypothetical protein
MAMGAFVTRLFHWMDNSRFGHIQVWEFGIHSLAREYAWLFFRKAVLAHPLKAVRGLRRYQRFILNRPDRAGDAPSSLAVPDEDVFRRGAESAGSRPLVGLGFCLKPVDPATPSTSCPSGRANHECLYLEKGKMRPACADCVIRDIGSRCLAGGCPVYIMTSAKDIARDLLIPQVNRGAFPSAVLLLCPYSVQAIIPPLFICDMDVLLLTYAAGSCADYGQWLGADRGIKPERTRFAGEPEEELFALLERLEAKEWKEGARRKGRRFVRGGNIFYPG